MADCSQDAVEDEVELLANVLGEEPQHQVSSSVLDCIAVMR